MRSIKILILSLLIVCILPYMAITQEKPEIPLQELTRNLTSALAIGSEVLEVRNRLPQGMAPQDFLRQMSALQRRCEPIIVLIAQTNPPQEVQRYAMHIAMGIKGVELATWYYIYGILGDQSDYVQYADDLFKRGMMELQAADQIRQKG